MSKDWANAPSGKPFVDPQKVFGYKLAPFDYTYTERDLMLYAASIGFGLQDPTSEDVLQSTYESNENFGIFPSFAVIPPFKCIADLVGIPSLKFNPMLLLHGESEFFLHQRCSQIPTETTVSTHGIVTSLLDKKSGCSLELTAQTIDTNTKTLLFTNVMTLFIRGLTDFINPHEPYVSPIPITLPKNHTIPIICSILDQTTPQQAILYRLNGDYNPLHIDPSLARIGGFKQPILHGLCTLGFALRAVVHGFCHDNRDSVVNVKVRFVQPVIPGDGLCTEIYQPQVLDIPQLLQTMPKNTSQIPRLNVVELLNDGKAYQLVYFQTKVLQTQKVVLTGYAICDKSIDAKL